MLSVSSDAKTVPAILQAMWIMVPVLGQAAKQPCGNAPDLRPRKAHTPHSTAELLSYLAQSVSGDGSWAYDWSQPQPNSIASSIWQPRGKGELEITCHHAPGCGLTS